MFSPPPPTPTNARSAGGRPPGFEMAREILSGQGVADRCQPKGFLEIAVSGVSSRMYAPIYRKLQVSRTTLEISSLFLIEHEEFTYLWVGTALETCFTNRWFLLRCWLQIVLGSSELIGGVG